MLLEAAKVQPKYHCWKSKMIFLSSQKDSVLAQHLTRKVLGFDFHAVIPTHYPDGEIAYKDLPATTGQDVLIHHTFQPPVIDAWARLFFLLSAIDSRSITLLSPYLGFGRSRSQRGPKMLEELSRLGVDHLITFDYHRPEFLDAAPLEITHLSAKEIFIAHIQNSYQLSDCLVVAPDAGSRSRAASVSKFLNVPLVTMQKQRYSAYDIEMGHVAGDVTGKACLIFDDMISTSATLVQAADVLKNNGAKSIAAYCTHGLFLEDAVKKIEGSYLDGVVVTDTLEMGQLVRSNAKVTILSVASLLQDVFIKKPQKSHG